MGSDASTSSITFSLLVEVFIIKVPVYNKDRVLRLVNLTPGVLQYGTKATNLGLTWELDS